MSAFNIRLRQGTRLLTAADIHPHAQFTSLLMLGVSAYGENLQLMIAARQLRQHCQKLIGAFPDPICITAEQTGFFDQVVPFSAHEFIECQAYIDILVAAQAFPLAVDGMPYTKPTPDSLQKWQHRLSPMGGKKIGLVFASEPKRALAHLRTIPFESFAPLLSMDEFYFLSLQKQGLPKHHLSHQIFDCAPFLSDFNETAAIISICDLVLTVDTAIAHLAGALGVPVIVFLPSEGNDWRWQKDDIAYPMHPTIWYQSMRIFRQLPDEPWHATIARFLLTDVMHNA